MERYKRMACTKKRRIDNSERMSAAWSLLELSQDGNGSNFCEPHTGTSTATSISMCDIEDLERGYHNLEDENRRLLRECECLKEDNQRLLKENSSLREQYQHLQEECKKLKESKTESDGNKLSELSLSEELLRCKSEIIYRYAEFRYIDGIVQLPCSLCGKW